MLINTELNRRAFLQNSSLAWLSAGLAGVTGVSHWAHADEKELDWYDVRDWGVEGQGWSETSSPYDRLPARAEGVVRSAVWGLSRHSAGMLARFQTDAPHIWTHHKCTSDRLALPHMPATGVSGLDLYARDEAGQFRWLAVVRPSTQESRVHLVEGIKPGSRDYQLYLPLYNGTEFVKVGVPRGCSFTPQQPREEKPLLFYGTSITHGACASRPGMPHPAILGRRLDRPVINLGFSGNGKMEAEVGALLAELDPAVYIIDCLPNMIQREVAERAEPLVHQLRAARPETPILLVEDRTYTNAPFFERMQNRHAGSREALQTAYRNLVQAGVKHLHYLKGDHLLGDDREDATDGSHPSDLGFLRHADAFEPVLKRILAS